MNKVILIGNLCDNPEAYTTQSGVIRSTFKIAVQRRFTNASGVREADFLTVVAWRQTAEFCNKYLLKGRKIAVEGSIQTRSYDAQDGSKRYVTEIIADSVEALGGPKEGEGRPAEAPSVPSRNEQQRMDTSGFTEVEDDSELPF